MENFENKAKKYLENKHQQQSRKLGNSLEERKGRYFEAYRTLQKPFSDYEFQEEGVLDVELQGSGESSNESTKIHLEYTSEQNMKALFKIEGEEKAKLVRKIKKLRIESRRFVFDTDEVPVPQFGIFFKKEIIPGKEGQISTIGEYNSIMDEISLDFPITTPIGLLVMLHELGHFWRTQNLGDSITDLYRVHRDKNRKLSDAEKMLILEEERSADSIVLQETIEFLKPVVSPDAIKDFMNGSLLIYSGMLKRN